MASLGIRCGEGSTFLDCRLSKGNHNWENGCLGFCRVNNIGNSCRLKRGRMAMAVTVRRVAGGKQAETAVVKGNERKEASFVRDKMDEWMRDSVVEIVKNLKEAPLLVPVYSSEDDQSQTLKLKTEKAVMEEDWSEVVESWQRREARLPEGVIFVEKLEDENADCGDQLMSKKREAEEDVTRAWGIVVQGRGVDCGPICYLLKTSRAGGGLGMCCTHFCLMRVKSLRETTRSQLKNCWLLQGQ